MSKWVVGLRVEGPRASVRFHVPTVALHVGLKSNGGMEQMSIGEAARMLGLNTSALRYYEDRGFLTPNRHGGRRMYGRDELRRLAFTQLLQRLGISLDAAAAV